MPPTTTTRPDGAPCVHAKETNVVDKSHGRKRNLGKKIVNLSPAALSVYLRLCAFSSVKGPARKKCASPGHSFVKVWPSPEQQSDTARDCVRERLQTAARAVCRPLEISLLDSPVGSECGEGCSANQRGCQAATELFSHAHAEFSLTSCNGRNFRHLFFLERAPNLCLVGSALHRHGQQ